MRKLPVITPDILRALVERAGGARQLSEATGIHRVSISRILHAHRNAGELVVRKLVDAFPELALDMEEPGRVGDATGPEKTTAHGKMGGSAIE